MMLLWSYVCVFGLLWPLVGFLGRGGIDLYDMWLLAGAAVDLWVGGAVPCFC